MFSLSTVRCALICLPLRILPSHGWCRHSTGVTLFSQVRLDVPDLRSAADTAEGANFVIFDRAGDSTGGVKP